MHHIFVDFEMNPIDKKHTQVRLVCRQEIIEFGAVKLDEAYREVDSFRRYVKPTMNGVKGKIVEITGITDKKLRHEPGFEAVLKEFLDWCGDGEKRFYAWSDNDLKQLINEIRMKNVSDPRLEGLEENWSDFQQEYVQMLGLTNRISLGQAVGSTESTFDGEAHDALWDARNTADLFRMSRDKEKFRQRMHAVLEALDKEKQEKQITISEKCGKVLQRAVQKE